MGRLLGLPYFLSEEALAEQKADAATIRRTRVDLDDSTEGNLAKDLQMVIAQRMQVRFDGHILRRTVESLDWKKEPLVSLPPYEDIMIVVKPTAREMEIISELADGVKERYVVLDFTACCSANLCNSVSASNGLLHVVSRSFYIDHRMSVGFARLDLDEKIPTFQTLEDWEAKKSTKIDTCARMCQHILTRDDAPAISVNDGAIFFPLIPIPALGNTVPRETKILIYQEFPSLGPLLRNVSPAHFHTLYS